MGLKKKLEETIILEDDISIAFKKCSSALKKNRI